MSGIITVSNLGKKGRAGNAMFQFAFAMGYAKAMGCDLLTNDWWGRRVFPAAAAIPIIDLSNLRKTHCDSVCHLLSPPLPLDYFFGQTDIDLNVYAQHQLHINFYSRKDVREWFRLNPELEAFAPNAKNFLSVKHLRRGDYTTDPTFQRLYCTVSDESYDQAIKTFNIPEPIIPVFDGCDRGMRAISVKYLAELGVPWLHDWLLLREAAHLLRSNSTFAWWAATLGNGKVYSPLVEDKVGNQTVSFTEGNWPNTAGVFKNQSNLHLKE